MKKLSLFVLTAIMALTACHNNPSDEPQKKGSSGKTLEMMIVADKNVYTGETKQLIDSLFGRPQVGLPVPESMFDIVNIPVSSYKSTEMFRNHRNILYFDVNPNNPDKVYKHIDEYAAPQVVFDFAAKDQASLREMLRKYEPFILDEVYKAEHRRVIKAFKGMENFKVNEAIRKQFGFGLMFSNEFAIAKQKEDFAWVRKEAKDFGMGVLIDVFSYTDQNVFNEQNILDRLDTIMKRHVPGSKDSSYAGIERRRTEQGEYLAPITFRQVDFNGSDYCIETRGCWRTFGDFMGGPFVTYTLLSPSKKKVIMLTGYVYCPRNKPWTKRDLLMQAESICWSLQF
ncbi:MAG: DUF4837 family protein [Bacteroidales bacterium]|nr:DUF4837 family protein [Bacteroidales bacterium]